MSKRYILNATIEFSPEEHQLSAHATKGPAVKLNTPVSRCLELLIERRYNLVPHQTFYTYVWGEDGASVPANSLYQNIALLRKALKTFQEDGDKIINTVPKQGFSLHADVAVEEVDSERRGDVPPPPLSTGPLIVDKENAVDVIAAFPSVKVVHPERRGINYLLPTCLIALLGLMAWQLIQQGYPSSIGYLEKYTEKTLVSGCQVFTEHIVQNVAEVRENIEATQIDCAKTPYVYITGFQYSQQTSLLSCEHPLEGSITPGCFVNNIMGNNTK